MSYKPEQEAVLSAEAQPITYARAKELADELGKSQGSVISKILSMEIPYTRKPKAAPKKVGPTKAQLVAEIANEVGVTAEVLQGLDKATAAALHSLLVAVI